MAIFEEEILSQIFEKCLSERCRRVFLWRVRKMDGMDSNLHNHLRLSY